MRAATSGASSLNFPERVAADLRATEDDAPERGLREVYVTKMNCTLPCCMKFLNSNTHHVYLQTSLPVFVNHSETEHSVMCERRCSNARVGCFPCISAMCLPFRLHKRPRWEAKRLLLALFSGNWAVTTLQPSHTSNQLSIPWCDY